jgi:hypothetical protein
MDSIYIIAIIVQVGILIFFLRRSFTAKKKSPKASLPNQEVNVPEPDSYEAARLAALHVTAQQLGLQIPAAVTKVYGVVMDWDMGGTVLSLIAYINGGANALLSSGATVTGAGADPEVAKQASEFVQVAQDYLNRGVPVSDLGYPPPGTVRFYLLTNKGIFAVQELLSLINDNSSPLLGLFFRGNMVLDEIKSSKIVQGQIA